MPMPLLWSVYSLIHFVHMCGACLLWCRCRLPRMTTTCSRRQFQIRGQPKRYVRTCFVAEFAFHHSNCMHTNSTNLVFSLRWHLHLLVHCAFVHLCSFAVLQFCILHFAFCILHSCILYFAFVHIAFVHFAFLHFAFCIRAFSIVHWSHISGVQICTTILDCDCDEVFLLPNSIRQLHKLWPQPQFQPQPKHFLTFHLHLPTQQTNTHRTS